MEESAERVMNGRCGGMRIGKKQEEGEGAEALVSASAQLYVLAGVLGCVRQLSQ